MVSSDFGTMTNCPINKHGKFTKSFLYMVRQSTNVIMVNLLYFPIRCISLKK